MHTWTRVRAVLLGAAAVLGATALIAGPAHALPPGGASADTPGTSSSVSPSTVRAGEVIRFTVSGFPAGEILSIKIDDGQTCSQQAVHGACVYHQQKIGSSGSVSGSFVVPADLAPGQHWLRYLASAEVRGADGSYQGVEGYSNRGGSDFTVVAASRTGTGGGAGESSGGAGTTSSGSGSGAAGSANGDGTTDGSSTDGGSTGGGSLPDSTGSAGSAGAGAAPTAGGTVGSGVVRIAPSQVEEAPDAAVGAVPAGTLPPTQPPSTLSASSVGDDDLPIVGMVGFVGLLLLAALLWGLSLRRAGPVTRES